MSEKKSRTVATDENQPMEEHMIEKKTEAVAKQQREPLPENPAYVELLHASLWNKRPEDHPDYQPERCQSCGQQLPT